MELDFDDIDIPISDARLSHLSPRLSSAVTVTTSTAGKRTGQSGSSVGKKGGLARSNVLDHDEDEDDDGLLVHGVDGMEDGSTGLMDWQSIEAGDFDFSSTFPSSTPQIQVQTDLPRSTSPRLFDDPGEDDLLTPSTARPIVGAGGHLEGFPIHQQHSVDGSHDFQHGSYSSSVATGFAGSQSQGQGHFGNGGFGHGFGPNMPSHPSQPGQHHFTQPSQPLQHHAHAHSMSHSFAGPGLSMSMINPPKLFGQETNLPFHTGQPAHPFMHTQNQQQPLQGMQPAVIPPSALWPGSASLPNLAGSSFPLTTFSPDIKGATGKKGVKAQDKRPKKRARTSEGTDDEAVSKNAVDLVDSKEQDQDDEGSDAEGTELGEIGDETCLSQSNPNSFVPGLLGLRDGNVLDLGPDADSPTGSGLSLVNGFTGLQPVNGFSLAETGGADAGDMSGSDHKDKDGKPRLKSGSAGKKKKIPPPGGFKPWNTSPSSSHLPSGSACINPVTGEVELPPMDNLTKEEIRKVKNRASAQRSRTRKGELLGGLMDEVNRLRERLRDVTNGAEGGDGDDASMGAEEFLRKTHAARSARGGSVMSSTGSIGRDEEKEGMKMLIERLRAEVDHERKAREAAEAQGWIWKSKHDQLISNLALGAGKTINPGLVSDPPSSLRNARREEDVDKAIRGMADLDTMDDDEDEDDEDGADEDELMELSVTGHLDAAATTAASVNRSNKIERAQRADDGDDEAEDDDEDREGGREMVQARRREKAIVKGTQRDSKGVLMMVVLFSFALFSLPPHLRTPGFNTSTAFHMSTNGNAEAAALFDKLLPYGTKGSSSSTSAEMDVEGEDDTDALLAMADAASKGVGHARRQPVKGRKSLSFTLLKPIDEEKAAEFEKAERKMGGSVDEAAAATANGTVEDVLEKWLGLSLFDNGSGKQTDTDAEASDKGIPGGWIVVKSSLTADNDDDAESKDDRRFERASDMSSRSSTASPITKGFKSLTAWDGTPIESMQLDEDVLSVSHHGHDEHDDHPGFLRAAPRGDGLTMPFAPDKRAKPDGPSPTLAPEFQEDPLADEHRNQRAASVPTSGGAVSDGTARRLPAASSSIDRHRRQSLSVLGNGPFPGFTPSYPSAAASASSPRSAGSPSASGSTSASTRAIPSSPASTGFTPTRVRSMPSSALMQLEDRPASEKYMKLELEVDFEVELTCRGVRTRSATATGSPYSPGSTAGGATSDKVGDELARDRGISLVGKDEVGRLLSSGLDLGKQGGFLSLGL